MFDIAWSELALISLIALIVIGPKDLPRALRTLGQWVRKIRLMAGEFQRNIDDMVRQAELDEVKREIEQVRATDLKREVEKAIDPDGDLERSMRLDEPPRVDAARHPDGQQIAASRPEPDEDPAIRPAPGTSESFQGPKP